MKKRKMSQGLAEIFNRMEQNERMTMEKAQQIYKAHQGEGMFITEQQAQERLASPKNLANKIREWKERNGKS